MSASTLVAVGRGWTPEEAARHEVALYSALASDKQALRVYLQKVRVVETVRAGRQQHVASLPEGNAKPQAQPSTGAGRRSSGSPGQPLAADTEPRARRRKSKAQQLKSVKKLQHKWLKRRCEAAAAKAGGSPARVLARVLACCGRFWELLHPEGAERMARDYGSQKVQHYLDVISYKIKAILKSRIVVSTNSADLERVPGTRSIGAEFAETTILVTKL